MARSEMMVMRRFFPKQTLRTKIYFSLQWARLKAYAETWAMKYACYENRRAPRQLKNATPQATVPDMLMVIRLGEPE